MSINLDLPKGHSSIIKVLGVGGGGGNAVNYMFKQGISGVDFVLCNTDNQALDQSNIPIKLRLGKELTAGYGAGSKPEIGKLAAEESIEELRELLAQSTKMVFVTAGMGGGTGTGAAPIIAKVAREMGILTVGIVTLPFNWEGKKKKDIAEKGLAEMMGAVDTIIVIENDRIAANYGDLPISQAFGLADEILASAAKSISNIITLNGYVNVDFEDVKTVMSESGVALMGTGHGTGADKAKDAVLAAINSPLLASNDIKGAKNVLMYITYNTDEPRTQEITEISDIIQEHAGNSAEIIWGHGIDTTIQEGIYVTIIATGFQASFYHSNGSASSGNKPLATVEAPISNAPVLEAPARQQAPAPQHTLSAGSVSRSFPIATPLAFSPRTPQPFISERAAGNVEKPAATPFPTHSIEPTAPVVEQQPASQPLSVEPAPTPQATPHLYPVAESAPEPQRTSPTFTIIDAQPAAPKQEAPVEKAATTTSPAPAPSTPISLAPQPAPAVDQPALSTPKPAEPTAPNSEPKYPNANKLPRISFNRATEEYVEHLTNTPSYKRRRVNLINPDDIQSQEHSNKAISESPSHNPISGNIDIGLVIENRKNRFLDAPAD